MTTRIKNTAFDKAKEAISTLKVVGKILNHAERETLEILMDKELSTLLSKSIEDVKKSRISPLKSIR